MDQDSFRKILNTPRTSAPSVLGGGSRARISLAPLPKSKTVDASQPGFKPRTVKKTKDSRYRDRASERRVGDGNDYAHVEAVLDEFEKRNTSTDKETLETQRKYLGGDAEHSILVKGLDFALLEQNKARTILTNEDVDALDEVYKEASRQEPIVPKKRTREDILAELKKSREAGAVGKNDALAKSAEEEVRLLEEAKQKGKFKPIGFKPIGPSKDGKKKHISTDGVGGEKKKKKKLKVENETALATTETSSSLSLTSVPPKPIPKEPEEPVYDDFDIFADAGEYDPLDLDLDDGECDDEREPPGEQGPSKVSSSAPQTLWISAENTDPQEKRPVLLSTSTVARSVSPYGHTSAVDENMEDEQPKRLVPLFSSALPSIKDLLAADKAAGSYGKKKKKALASNGSEETKKRSLESKVDRDYKRLKTYTDKKAASLDNGG